MPLPLHGRMDASYERHEPHGWGGGMNFYGNMPDTYKVSVNANHKLVNKILSLMNRNKLFWLNRLLILPCLHKDC
jgi:hypothetical protein